MKKLDLTANSGATALSILALFALSACGDGTGSVEGTRSEAPGGGGGGMGVAGAAHGSGNAAGGDAGLDEGGGANDDAGLGGTGPLPATPPYVVTMIPDIRAIGVRSDTLIQLEFSEPMNTQDVEDAVEIASHYKNVYHFSWNEEETTLTITPQVPLAYGNGYAELGVVAQVYTLRLSGVVRDAEGDVMESPFINAFKTLRQITQDAPLEETMSGCILLGGGNNATIQAGDSGNNTIVHGLLSFDLTDFPEDAEVLEATLRIEQSEVGGSPFSNLDDGTASGVRVWNYHYNSRSSAGTLSTVGRHQGVLSDSAALGSRQVDLTTPVTQDFSARAPGDEQSQFALTFPIGTNSNGEWDVAVFESPELQVTYLTK